MKKTKPDTHQNPTLPRDSFTANLSPESWLVYFIFLIVSAICLWQFMLPYFAERHYRDGYNFSVLKRNNYAIEEFEIAVNQAPWETQYQVELGRIYEAYADEQPTPQQAMEYINKAENLYFRMIDLDQLNPWFQNRLAIIYARKSEMIPDKRDYFMNLAQERTKIAAELDNQNPLFQLNYASFLHRMGKIEEAIPYYEKTLRYDPGMSEALYNLADIYRRQNRLDLTLKLYEDLHKQNPDFQNLNLALASTYIQMGRYTDATIALEETVSKNPQQLEPLKTLGSLYFQQKEWLKAAIVYGKIVTFFPESHDMHQFKVQALVQAGKPQEAFSDLQDYLSSYPDDAIAKSQYQNLKNILKK